MADGETPVLKLVMPEVTKSIDTWGGKLNDNMQKIDVQVGKDKTNSENALKKDSPDVLERTTKQFLYYDPSIATKPHLGDAKALMTNESVRALCNLLMPIGTIIMWAGTVANIPTDWALCNGATVNGNVTPNLADRFVMAGGSTNFPPGTTGGNSVLNYSGTVGGHVLTINEIPAHTHDVYDPQHRHSASQMSPAGFSAPGTSDQKKAFTESSNYSAYAPTGIALYNNGSNWGHDHPFGFSIPWGTYWPQFYALCFIMRIRLL